MNHTEAILAGPEAVLHTLRGLESNIYFNALHSRPVTEEWEPVVTCELGNHLADRWRFVPGPDLSGRHHFTLRLRDPQTGEELSCASEIHIHSRVPGRPDRPLRWLPIGDSLTAAGGYVEAAIRLAAVHDGNIVSLGTQETTLSTAIRHEGYPGWKFGDFLQPRTSGAGANFRIETAPPFLVPGAAPALDFRDYCHNALEGHEPDVITVFLGPNDMALLDEKTLPGGLRETLDQAEALLGGLLHGTSRAAIGLIPPLPPSSSQDAFGLDYGCLIPRWRYRRNQHALVRALQSRFRNYHPRLSLIPAFLQIDPATGYPSRTEPVHAFTHESRQTASDSMHPSAAGHAQIAAAILAWMAGNTAAF